MHRRVIVIRKRGIESFLDITLQLIDHLRGFGPCGSVRVNGELLREEPGPLTMGALSDRVHFVSDQQVGNCAHINKEDFFMTDTNPLNGTWYSAAGSQLVLEVKGTVLTGKLSSAQDPIGFVPVFGSVASAQSNADFLPVAFSASWPSGDGEGPSVTSYTGQYTNRDRKERIEVIFLLANQVKSTVLWKSTCIASDLFTRSKP